jgi:VWFA-related protein
MTILPFRTLFPTLLTLLALGTFALVSPAMVEAKDKDKISRAERKELRAAAEKLPEKHRQWLEEVDPIITDQELKSFIELEQDYQRDAFIKRFWEVRDPYKGTARNEFKDRYASYVEEARNRFGRLDDDRSRILLLNGAPAVSVVSSCSTLLWPLEVWFYQGSEQLGGEFFIVFYRKWGAGPYRIWNPLEGLETLFSDTGAGSIAGGDRRNLGSVANGCRDGDKLAAGIGWVLNQRMGYTTIQSRIEAKPEGPGGEWVASFGSYSTEVPAGAALLNAKLDVEFPGRHQNRTVLEGLLTVPVAEAGLAKLGEHRSYSFLINGEVLQNGELFDNFRYRFDFPGDAVPEGGTGSDASLPLVFHRYLRPGDYTMILRLEDINSGKLFRAERPLNVPAVEGNVILPPPRTPEERESARLLEAARAAISNGETTIKILRPPGDLQAGMLRFDTLTTGDIATVTFALDGKPVLTKKKPPYSVELDLGSLPRPRRLTVSAFGVDGRQIASDELLVNSAGHRFRVRLVEPQRGQRYQGSLLARIEPEVPDGQTLDRIELFLNESRVATLYQAPFTQPIILPKEEIAYVRAVGYLIDGNSTEDLVFVNSPDYIDQVNVDFVELYTTVFDRGGHPVEGMEQKDFTVIEDGQRQEIARFEKVTDLPIHATVALDVSASMEDNLGGARDAALKFIQETIRPKDRAAVILFNDRPTLTTKFSSDQKALAGGLAGIKAERGTALYDTIVFTLYYNNGIKGQRAVLLLSDGKDEGSRFTYEDALEYARRAGVTIYTIGLGDDVDKKKLEKIAEETGGRFFQVGNASQLSGIYSTIEKELRSQYLIAYQSTNTSGATDFRTVELKVGKSGLEAKTMRGYYP